METTWSAAELVLKTTVILSVAYAASLVLRRSSASARYVVWLCACTAVLAVPVLTTLGLEWPIDVAPRATSLVTSDATAIDTGASVAQSAAPNTPSNGATTWPLLLWAAGTIALFAYWSAVTCG